VERLTNDHITAAAHPANLSPGQRLLNYRCGDAEAPAAPRATIKTACKRIASSLSISDRLNEERSFSPDIPSDCFGGKVNVTMQNTGKATVRQVATLFGCAISAALTATPAMASTQGTLGTTSTGSITISVSVANRAQITGLSDVTFTNIDPATAASAAQNNCVWSNTATKGYSITATGSGTSGAFTLANGPLTVPYSVQWSQTSGQSTGTALTAGTALTGLATTAANPTCSTSPSTTSSLVVTISAPSLQSMVSATTYTGSLTLLVTPQ